MRSSWVSPCVAEELDTAAERLTRLVREGCPQSRALILTGSAARGEATIAPRPGSVQWLSDLELLVVIPDSAPLRHTTTTLDELARKFRSAMKARKVTIPVELTPAPEKYFERIRPHVFGYELKHCGRTLYGSSDYLARIPSFHWKDIPKEDAWRLISNRMLEWLEYMLEGRRRPLPFQFYVLVKIWLDLETALSLFSGDYRPTYRERAERLDHVVGWAVSHNCPLPSQSFSDAVRTAVNFKFDPCSGFEWLWCAGTAELRAELRRQGLAHIYDELQEALLAAWRWAGREISNGLPEAGGVAPVYGFARRMRGWAKLLICMPARNRPGVIARMMRLSHLGSPRSLVYACAARLLEAAVSGDPDTLAWVRRRLPVPASGGEAWQGLARRCLAVWRLCLRQADA